MKKTILSILIFAFGAANAQTTQISLGADVNFPVGDFGDFYTLGVGPAAGIEFPVGKLGITAQVSYNLLTPKSKYSELVKNSSMVPAHLGLKYYFVENQNGCYISGQAGVHNTSVKVADTSESDTNFSWSAGAGYQFEKFDIGLRYATITAEGDNDNSNYIGLRLSYLLNL